MLQFREWLLVLEAGRAEVPLGVLAGYDHAFRTELQKLIARIQSPALSARLQQMVDCPIRDSRGQCRGFSDYIVSALIKNGIHHRYDIEAALSYVVEKMLMPVGYDGEPRATVFGGFEERPDDSPDFNPVQVRLLKYLQLAIGNIRRGKIPRLANAEQRPQGTVSIGMGRRKDGDPTGGLSPDEVAARTSGEDEAAEMVEDIAALLRRKESQAGFPLAALFHAIMAGQTLDQQRRTFGDRPTRAARQVIIDTIRDYASGTDNHALLNQLSRLTGGAVAPSRAKPVQPARPVLTDRERDYASIASVIARLDRPVGTADLGKYRRRWLEYAPRDPSSACKNRLEEVLARMTADNVLRATRTRNGALVYSPGPEFEKYRQLAAGEPFCPRTG